LGRMLAFFDKNALSQQVFVLMAKDKVFVQRILEPAKVFSKSREQGSAGEELESQAKFEEFVSCLIKFSDSKA